MSHNPIGLFDSGIGGLSIWQALQKVLPAENTVYAADNLNAPYGDKTKDEIIALSEKNTEFLLEQNAKIIVVACNTASTNAIPHLRQKYSVPFIRIQPAIKPAGLQSRTKKIGLLATKGTLQSDMLEELKSIIPTQDLQIINQYGKGLVEIVEENRQESPETYRLLARYLKPMLEQNVDQLVLGCTHYPFLIPQIKKIAGNQLHIVEPSMAIARQTKRILEQQKLLNTGQNKPRHIFYANKDTRALQTYLQPFKDVQIKLTHF